MIFNQHHGDAPEDAVWIMRPSMWSNRFRIGPGMTRDEAIEAFRLDLWKRIKSGEMSMESLAMLHGRNLLCCCVPKACHGHVLERAAKWAFQML